MAQDRHPAYAELVAALLALRPDPATARFDALLSELVASDRLDPEDARELRWWQRESVRAVGDYVAEAVPALLVGLETSQRAAVESAAAAAAAWNAANHRDDHEPIPDPAGPGPARPGPTGPEAPGSAPEDGAAGATSPAAGGVGDTVVDLRTGGPRPGPGPTRASGGSAATVTDVAGGVPSPRRRLLLPSGSLSRYSPDVRP